MREPSSIRDSLLFFWLKREDQDQGSEGGWASSQWPLIECWETSRRLTFFSYKGKPSNMSNTNTAFVSTESSWSWLLVETVMSWWQSDHGASEQQLEKWQSMLPIENGKGRFSERQSKMKWSLVIVKVSQYWAREFCCCFALFFLPHPHGKCRGHRRSFIPCQEHGFLYRRIQNVIVELYSAFFPS